MNKKLDNTIIDSIIKVLSQDDRVLFAYLYGSTVDNGKGNDIDIAVYSVNQVDFHKLAADLKIALHKATGFPPDIFDVRVLNGVTEQGDIFALFYLKNILSQNHLLLDRAPDIRSDFLERYGFRFRESEGLFQEILS